MANKFIYEDFDKFSNKKTVTMNDGFLVPVFGMKSAVGIMSNLSIYWRHVSLPSGDTLLLDVYYKGTEWFFLRDGTITVNINDVENVVLEPHSVYSKTKETAHSVACTEYVYYEVDQDIFKKICEAQSVDLKITGEFSVVLGMNDWKDHNFVKYSQRFYNGLYDENAYRESLIDSTKSDKSSSGSGCAISLMSFITVLSSFVALLFIIIGYFDL